MTRSEAERAFGRPIDSSVKEVAGLEVTTLIFNVGDQHLNADFVEQSLNFTRNMMICIYRQGSGNYIIRIPFFITK